MYDDREYLWGVLCKNHRFHHKGNTSYSHQIVLAETDAYSPLPMLTQQAGCVVTPVARSMCTSLQRYY